MLKSHEKIILFHYLKNILNSQYLDDIEASLIEWLNENKRKIDFFSPNLNKYDRYEMKTGKKYSTIYKNIIKDLNDFINSQNTKNERTTTNLYKNTSLLAELLKLNKEETDILLLALACKSSRLLDSLWDSFSKGSYSRNCFCKNIPLLSTFLNLSEIQINNLLSSSSSLVKTGLLKIDTDSDITILSKLNWICNQKFKSKEDLKQLLVGNIETPTLKWNDFEHLNKEKDLVLKIIKAAQKSQKKGINILFYGLPGTGKTELCKLIAKESNSLLYKVAEEDEDGDEAKRGERLSDLKLKQKLLENDSKPCILFDEAEDVMNRGYGENGESSKVYMNRLLENTTLPVFWTTNNINDVDTAFLRRMTFAVQFKELSKEIRVNIWKKEAKKNKFKIKTSELEQLGNDYDISPSVISNSISCAKMINGDIKEVKELLHGVSKAINKGESIKKTAKEAVIEKYNLSLANTDLSIEKLSSQLKSSGKLNFSLCLYGVPGTGKSAYARYIADELGLKVIQKRGSDLISMWVGGTEKNIAKAFEEALEQKAVLVFDEADSFLQSRNKAQRSWEITQVNEMLTWMEKHPYPFICTTNLLESLDDASLRRFAFKIKFDFLNPSQIKQAFEHFFNLPANNNITAIHGLTPGDFVVVQKKAEFLNLENNIEEIEQMLKAEAEIKSKGKSSNSIGFYAD